MEPCPNMINIEHFLFCTCLRSTDTFKSDGFFHHGHTRLKNTDCNSSKVNKRLTSTSLLSHTMLVGPENKRAQEKFYRYPRWERVKEPYQVSQCNNQCEKHMDRVRKNWSPIDGSTLLGPGEVTLNHNSQRIAWITSLESVYFPWRTIQSLISMLILLQILNTLNVWAIIVHHTACARQPGRFCPHSWGRRFHSTYPWSSTFCIFCTNTLFIDVL